MSLRAISLWQPYATAMAKKLKKNETRSWPTSHRGELAICASKHRPSDAELGHDPALIAAAKTVPYGKVLCVVILQDCVPSEEFNQINVKCGRPRPLAQAERDLGDYSAGRWIWMTDDCQELAEAVPVVGHQGLFFLPSEVEERVRQQLCHHLETKETETHIECACCGKVLLP